MPNAAIYARYSTDEQRDTSLEDQVRRCREEAKKRGFEVPDALVFTDAALSGTAAAVEKRAGYRALIEAWKQRAFEAVIVDEVSRLARDPLELAKLQQRVEESRVRLITADGIDSATPNWQLPFGLAGIVGAHFLRETKHRVIRGMQGQLEADIRLHRPDWLQCVHDTDGSHTIGTRWQIDDEKANLSAKSFRCVARDVAVCNRERMNDEACGHRGRHVTDCKVLAPNLASRVYTTRFTREIHVNGSTFTHHRGQSGRKSGVEYQRPSFAG